MMKNDLPECDINTCKHYYDGNCTDLVRHADCKYVKHCNDWEKARLDIKNVLSRCVAGASENNGMPAGTNFTAINSVLNILSDLK